MALLARLKAFAALAFCAAMARLPGHWSPTLLPLKATAQTTPCRLTTAAHSLLSRPPLLGPPPGLTLFLRISASWSWSTGQEITDPGLSCAFKPADTKDAAAQIADAPMTDRLPIWPPWS